MRHIATAALLVLLAMHPQAAQAGRIIVLEAYDGERPPDADQVLTALKSALEHHGAITNPGKVVELLDDTLPLPGNPDRDITRAELLQRIELGMRRAAHEAYGEAAVILEGVLRDVDRNPALTASDPNSRVWVTKARVALAFAYSASKKPALANQIIADHVRTYPDVSLSGEQEQVARLYNGAKAVINQGPYGMLVFKVNRPDAVIFVDDRQRGEGEMTVALLPGAHRIVVRAAGLYRVYHVALHANDTLEKSVDWPADAAFVVGPSWLGLAATGNNPALRDQFFARLAAPASGDVIVVVGVSQADGHRHIVARRYASADAHPRPGRTIELDKATDAEVEALASYLTSPNATATEVGGLLPVPGEPEERASEPADATDAGPRRWPMLAAATTFAVALPTGALFLRENTNCYPAYMKCSSTDVWIGSAFLSIGGVALAFGVYWALHTDKPEAPATVRVDVQPGRGGGLVTIGGAF